MLPSHGLLKSFPCPYYVSGFCERPHCLFRHERKDAIQALKAATFLIPSEDSSQDGAVVSYTPTENKYDYVPSRKNYSVSNRKDGASVPSSLSRRASYTKDKPVEVPTTSTPYVTPLNQSLPLPVFPKEDLKPTKESVKRVSDDPVENSSKRRKISDNSNPNCSSAAETLSVLTPDSTDISIDTPAVTADKNVTIKNNDDAQKGNDINPNVTEGSSSFPQQSENKTSSSSEVEKAKKSSSSPRKDADKKSRHKDSKSDKESKNNKDSRSDKERPSDKDSKRHKDSHKSSHSSSRSHSSHSHKSKHTESSKKSSDSKHKSSSSLGKSSEGKRSEKHSDKSKSSSSHSRSSSSSSKSPDKGHRRSSHKNKDKKDKPEDSVEKSVLCQDFAEIKGVSEEFRVPEYYDSDDDPDEVAMECLKMFEDYSADETAKGPQPSQTSMSALNSSFDDPAEAGSAFGKKRFAHTGAEQRMVSSAVKNSCKGPPTYKELTQMMLQRIEQKLVEENKKVDVTGDQNAKSNPVQEAPIIPRKKTEIPVTQSSKFLTSSSASRDKKRIAHVSNVNLYMKPQSNVQSNNTSASTGNAGTVNKAESNPYHDFSTIAQTNVKGQSRVSHTPNKALTQSQKPQLTIEAASMNTKVPLAYRQKILLQMYQECLKWFPDAAAAERARKEEAEVAGRCASKMVYFSAATNAITRLRKEWSTDKSNNDKKLADSKKLAGSAGPKASWSIESRSKNSFTLPVGPKLYQSLKKFLLAEDDLDIHGYPLPHPSGEPGRAVSKIRRKKEHKPINGVVDPTSRHCERCAKPYKTDADGMPLIMEKCVYHFGRRFNKKTKGLLDSRYTCCDGEPTSEGCSIAPTHVSSVPGAEDDLTGFVTTVKDPGEDSEMGTSIWDIIALDCEMVYTTVGSELARVTIVDCQKQILYDQLVMPPHPVLDYNTRFSGITEEIMLEGHTVSLLQVQAVLLTQLKPNSILIGHSLESDLHALKLIHRSVIDTSVLYPHRLGLPYKRALRTLSAEYCGQIIQSSVNGHNSSEDALAALDLVYYKLKQQA